MKEMENSRLLSRGGAHAAHMVYMAGYVTPWMWWQSHYIWYKHWPSETSMISYLSDSFKHPNGEEVIWT